VKRQGIAAAALLALAGCPFHPRVPQPRTLEGEWGLARNAATRRVIVYDGLKHRATATATYLSLPVREARARRLAEWLGWTPQELQDRLDRERDDAAHGEEFLLCFYTADARANDLDAPRSVWRVALKVGTEDVLASRVTSIDSDATIVGLFPYVGPFDVVYRVFLPHAPSGALEGRPFVLELASALAKVEVDFGVPNGRIADEPWQPVPAP